MGFRSRLPALLCLLLLGRCTAETRRFLMDSSSHDETLQAAFSAIQDLNTRLQSVMADNDMLKQQLQDAQNALQQHSTTLGKMEHRMFSEFIWFDSDWALVFRATKGLGQPAYTAWTNHGHHDDDPLTRATMPCGCTTVNGSLPCDRHYRSRLLDSWPSAAIDEVKLVLYENGVEKEHITFSGTGSDYMSWFSQSRIVESSWTDLKTATGLNYFTIEGHPSEARRFFINHGYHSCPGDHGWLVVKDSLTETCDWGHVDHIPAILYAPSTNEVTWETHGFREADVLAVFVKFRAEVDFNQVCV